MAAKIALFGFIYLRSYKEWCGVQGGRKGFDEARRLSKLAFLGADETIACKHCLCGGIFKVSQSPLLLKWLNFGNEQGHIIQQPCVSDERGKSLNLQFHAAPPRLWFLPLGLPDKIQNFKHAVSAHPVRAEIEDEALWVSEMSYMLCRPAAETLIMPHQAYTMRRAERPTNITRSRASRKACELYILTYRYIDVVGPAAAGETCAEIGYTFIQTVSDSP